MSPFSGFTPCHGPRASCPENRTSHVDCQTSPRMPGSQTPPGTSDTRVRRSSIGFRATHRVALRAWKMSGLYHFTLTNSGLRGSLHTLNGLPYVGPSNVRYSIVVTPLLTGLSPARFGALVMAHKVGFCAVMSIFLRFTRRRCPCWMREQSERTA